MAALPYPAYETASRTRTGYPGDVPDGGDALSSLRNCQRKANRYQGNVPDGGVALSGLKSAAGKVGETLAPPDLDTLRLILTPPLGEQHAGCDRNVEAFNVAGAFDRDTQIGAGQCFIGNTITLLA